MNWLSIYGGCIPAILLLCATGCGSAGDYHPVTGKVTLDGQPLADARVVFTPTDETGQSAFGKTDASGTYSMISGTNKGVTPGSYKVSVTSSPPESTETVDPAAVASSGEEYEKMLQNYDSAPKAPRFKDPIPSEYNSQTTLTCNVESGTNTYDIAIETK